MSQFSEWDWHSLLITVSPHESHTYAWLLLHRGTDGENKPLSATSFAERESSQKGRPAPSLYVWTHPLLDLSSLPELSAHWCFSLWRCSHTSVWRCIMVELSTQTNLLYYSPCPVHHVSLLSLCLWAKTNSQLLVHFEIVRGKTDQCIEEIKEDENCSVKLIHCF